MQYKQPENTRQQSFLPWCLDDEIGPNNPVRVIHAVVDCMDLSPFTIGKRTKENQNQRRGQPAFSAQTLFSIYLYGYMNRITSCRRLEQECHRNIEMRWLTGELKPNYKVIANFRKDNGKALENAFRQCVAILNTLQLIGGDQVAVDGTYLKASASRNSVDTTATLAKKEARIQKQIERYLAALDANEAEPEQENNPLAADYPACSEADIQQAVEAALAQQSSTEPSVQQTTDPHPLEADKADKDMDDKNEPPDDRPRSGAADDMTDNDAANTPNTAAPIAPHLQQLERKLKAVKDEQTALQTSTDTQISRTDQDARLLAKSGKTCVGFNTQISVDSQTKAIIAFDVNNQGNDAQQLQPMVEHTATALGKWPTEVLADSGYYNRPQIKRCLDQGIHVIIPHTNSDKDRQAKGFLKRDHYHYNEDCDQYTCPAGKVLSRQTTTHTINGEHYPSYRSKASDCNACPLREKCIKSRGNSKDAGKTKTIRHWEHWKQDAAHAQHMQTAEARAKLRQRSATVEHPFGTIKRWFGMDHFLTRGLEKVRGEAALMMTCYNIKRLTNALGGVEQALAALAAIEPMTAARLLRGYLRRNERLIAKRKNQASLMSSRSTRPRCEHYRANFGMLVVYG